MDLTTALPLIASAVPAVAPFLPYVTAAVTIAAAAATALPHPAAGSTSIYARVYDVINFVAFNFGRAKNAPAVTGA